MSRVVASAAMPPVLADALRSVADAADAKAIVDRLLAIAQQFRGAEPQHDDITLVVVPVTA